MERITEGALRPEQIVGKPLVVYIDGERRQIGTITHGAIRSGKLYFAADIALADDELEGVAAVMEEPS